MAVDSNIGLTSTEQTDGNGDPIERIDHGGIEEGSKEVKEW